MTWATARARIKTVLEGLSVSTPASQSMVRVYTSEPLESTHERPCVVMGPWSREPSSHPALLRKTFVQSCELLLVEHDRDQLLLFIESWQDAIETAFVADMTLNGAAAAIQVPGFPEWTGHGGIDGNPDMATVPFVLVVETADGVTYAA